MEPSISAQLDSVCFCNLVPPIPFPRFYPDSHLPVLPSIQPSNFPSSFERQTRQHLVNAVVLVHLPRGLFSAALNVRDQLFRSLSAYQVPQSVQYLFSSRESSHQVGFSFLCARYRKFCPWIASLEVFSLLSSTRVDQKLKALSPALFSSSHIGRHESWLLRSISSVGLMILIFLQSSH